MTDFAAKCANCGKARGYHQARTLHCPIGSKTRIGYIHFNTNSVFKHVKGYKRKMLPFII